MPNNIPNDILIYGLLLIYRSVRTWKIMLYKLVQSNANLYKR